MHFFGKTCENKALRIIWIMYNQEDVNDSNRKIYLIKEQRNSRCWWHWNHQVIRYHGTYLYTTSRWSTQENKRQATHREGNSAYE